MTDAEKWKLEADRLYGMNNALATELSSLIETWLPYLKELRNLIPDKINGVTSYRKLKINEEIRKAEAKL